MEQTSAATHGNTPLFTRGTATAAVTPARTFAVGAQGGDDDDDDDDDDDGSVRTSAPERVSAGGVVTLSSLSPSSSSAQTGGLTSVNDPEAIASVLDELLSASSEKS